GHLRCDGCQEVQGVVERPIHERFENDAEAHGGRTYHHADALSRWWNEWKEGLGSATWHVTDRCVLASSAPGAWARHISARLGTLAASRWLLSSSRACRFARSCTPSGSRRSPIWTTFFVRTGSTRRSSRRRPTSTWNSSRHSCMQAYRSCAKSRAAFAPRRRPKPYGSPPAPASFSRSA